LGSMLGDSCQRCGAKLVGFLPSEDDRIGYCSKNSCDAESLPSGIKDARTCSVTRTPHAPVVSGTGKYIWPRRSVRRVMSVIAWTSRFPTTFPAPIHTADFAEHVCTTLILECFRSTSRARFRKHPFPKTCSEILSRSLDGGKFPTFPTQFASGRVLQFHRAWGYSAIRLGHPYPRLKFGGFRHRDNQAISFEIG